LIEHGFTSAPTQYRLYGRRFFGSEQFLLVHMVSIVVIYMVIANWVAVWFFCRISTQLCLIVNIYM